MTEQEYELNDRIEEFIRNNLKLKLDEWSHEYIIKLELDGKLISSIVLPKVGPYSADD